jgi:hypothetical protein
MKTKTVTAAVFGHTGTLELMEFDDSDKKAWKVLFDSWKQLKLGMREYKAREPNFPEGLSEVAYCIWSDSHRFVSARGIPNTSFDTYNTKETAAEQVKACSVEKDLTSFGPRSKWDKLIFLDFYNEGKVDGRFDVYEIPSTLVYNHKVNANQTFQEQQLQGRRPRLSLKELIVRHDVQPVAKAVQIWDDQP